MTTLQRADVRPDEPTDKVAPLEYDVLAGAPITPLGAIVIGRKQDDGVADINISLELFNDRFPGIHLVSQNHWLQTDGHQKVGNGESCCRRGRAQ